VSVCCFSLGLNAFFQVINDQGTKIRDLRIECVPPVGSA
jgi:hypothetical protein